LVPDRLTISNLGCLISKDRYRNVVTGRSDKKRTTACRGLFLAFFFPTSKAADAADGTSRPGVQIYIYKCVLSCRSYPFHSKFMRQPQNNLGPKCFVCHVHRINGCHCRSGRYRRRFSLTRERQRGQRQSKHIPKQKTKALAIAPKPRNLYSIHCSFSQNNYRQYINAQL
jgi:hypothetical protein